MDIFYTYHNRGKNLKSNPSICSSRLARLTVRAQLVRRVRSNYPYQKLPTRHVLPPLSAVPAASG